jgi:hypothetical protein
MFLGTVVNRGLKEVRILWGKGSEAGGSVPALAAASADGFWKTA